MSQQPSQGGSTGPSQSATSFAFSSQPEGLSGTASLGSLNDLDALNGSGQQSVNTINADPNSPDLFTQNLAHAQQEVLKLQSLAHHALDSVQNAYHAGYSPEGTAGERNASSL